MKDKCVTCSKDSLYDKETHIDFRIGYIEGSGQLCLDCYDLIYIKPKVEDRFNVKNSKSLNVSKS
jgi:hypothetical protein